jgi:hypothetical protein
MKLLIDPYTKEEFLPRRRNQVFATAKNRMSFHNENAATLRQIKSPIDKQLEKNFLILSQLVPIGETKIFHRDALLMKGYNPEFFTHFTNYDGDNCKTIYHFILPTPDNPNFITIINPNNNL